jgi:chromosome segregation protein
VRLSSIKLSGFKSFVEPTVLQLPGQMVGVVGPNGCGKSNIMDAVRWVLGESKASELRGESMQDVIFNGTNLRKPASRASVELVFDNADHRAGGQWGQFAEIAVKRLLTRDGTSSYYINNQPVRRRDVQDVFMGTGLGPRAYAIIGQGTISRIIESRPEELRLFLEEAAGVSRYKERRRETESRLGDTRENLTRVEDILRELDGNLQHLEQQAEVAQRYHALQAELERKQQQLWFLKRADAQRELTRLTQESGAAQNQLDERLAHLRRTESDLATVRLAHFTAGDQVNQAQGQLYQALEQVSRLEGDIRVIVETRRNVEQRRQQLVEQSAQWTARHGDTLAESGQIDARIGAARRQEQDDSALAAVQAQAGPALEDALRAKQQQLETQRAASTVVQQQLQVLATEQRHVQEQSDEAAARLERLAREQGSVAMPEPAQLERAQQLWQEARRQAEQLESDLHVAQAALPGLEEQRRQHQQAVNVESASLAQLSARLSALRALQDRVRTDGKLKPWLARHGLDQLQPLWNQLHVEPGWESAIEAALRERLHALPVGRLALAAAFVADAPPTRLAFYQAPLAADPPGSAAFKPLLDMLRIGDAGLRALLSDWLHGCFALDSLDEALAAATTLREGEMVYLRGGHAVSRHGLSFYAADSEQSGLLARAQEIENLERQARAQALVAEQTQVALQRAEAAYAQAQARLVAIRRDSAEAQTRAHGHHMEAQRQVQLAEQAQQHSQRLEQDLLELRRRLADLVARQVDAQARFEQLDLQLADSQQRQAQFEEQLMLAERALSEQRAKVQEQAKALLEAQFALRALLGRQEELGRTISTALAHLEDLAAQDAAARLELERLSDTAVQAGLQDALALKAERELLLGARRSEYDDLSAKLRAGEEQRLRQEREVEPMRQRILDCKLREQAARLGLEQVELLLREAQADLDALAASVEQDQARLSALQPAMDLLAQQLLALGAVNLAALDELSAARERKQFLDSQSADLNAAMVTLQDAIRKIDIETRELLGSTFSAVNGHFGRMFPELFGGGHARLEMTGDEILDAGVLVMAQPPGKKNQTIHLLSGGEKALTAIALVFAIFQLNPAPFCLLDEVDAPLDDANTERYTRLVTSMSRETQFLFISHNKIAMEMAEQLIGVTMQEQGVSRIVAVDLESAASLAAA